MLREINVRRVMFVSFRESEATHWDRFVEDEPELAADFRRGADAVCFVSILRDQHYFCFGPREVDNGLGGTCTVLVSQKARVHGGRGSWTGKMLANYAEELGFKLIGRKRYEEAYAEAEEEKRKVIEAARRVRNAA
jgi:hypothetical protein